MAGSIVVTQHYADGDAAEICEAQYERFSDAQIVFGQIGRMPGNKDPEVPLVDLDLLIDLHDENGDLFGDPITCDSTMGEWLVKDFLKAPKQYWRRIVHPGQKKKSSPGHGAFAGQLPVKEKYTVYLSEHALQTIETAQLPGESRSECVDRLLTLLCPIAADLEDHFGAQAVIRKSEWANE